MRLFKVVDKRIVDRRDGPGVGALTGDPEAALRGALADWRKDAEPTHIQLCGMAGSRNGWREAPYASSPADESGWRAGALRLSLDEAPATILPGISGQTPAGAPDVMRGEETQVFGALRLRPELVDGSCLVLPGTHSKWVSVEGGRILGFQTFFTGEMFGLLRDRSTLTKVASPQAVDLHSPEAFDQGLQAAAGGALLGSLFQARSRQLLCGESPAWALSFLSGLLIGAECREALAAFRADRYILVGERGLADLYARAFQSQGRSTETLDGDACALAGLTKGDVIV
jgi:2-dehydro-3-deoxygalactonokinase